MSKGNIWMSFSDLMTGLMVIFLFVAIAYISRVQETAVDMRDYVEVKSKLHEELVSEFMGDTSRWQMTIGKDLSLKFKRTETLFPTGSAELTPEFKNILDEFLPKYFNILLKDTLMNKHITEIRIEGHTDDVPYPKLDPDPYIANVILSQRRALSVLRYFRSMPCYEGYSDDQKALLEYWFTANGLSYGKALDRNGNEAFDFETKKRKGIDNVKSRRVEFRIMTDSEKLLENFVKSNGDGD